MRPNARRFADDGDIDMVDQAAGPRDEIARMNDKMVRRGATPLRITGWEMIANISQSCSTEQCICERVEGDIGVAMTRQSPVMRNANATKPKVLTGLEAVYIETQSCA